MSGERFSFGSWEIIFGIILNVILHSHSNVFWIFSPCYLYYIAEWLFHNPYLRWDFLTWRNFHLKSKTHFFYSTIFQFVLWINSHLFSIKIIRYKYKTKKNFFIVWNSQKDNMINKEKKHYIIPIQKSNYIHVYRMKCL